MIEILVLKKGSRTFRPLDLIVIFNTRVVSFDRLVVVIINFSSQNMFYLTMITTAFGNPAAFFIALLIALGWLEICKLLVHAKLLQNWQRRKLLHVFTGPLFILTWPLFTNDYLGAIWATLVPLAMTAKFVAVGKGWLRDSDLVISASRNNSRAELLQGPTLYGLVFILTTLAYWKSVRAVICLMILCFGDGCAELAGRQFGKSDKLSYSRDKSFAGFVGFVAASFISTYFFLTYYGYNLFGMSFYRIGTTTLMTRLFVDCVVAGFVETLPIPEYDNITVFLAAIMADMVMTGGN